MESVYAEVGKRVRAVRQELELSQEILARRVGLTRTSVTNIESGSQRVPLHVVYRLAEALGRSAHDLLPEGAGPNRSEPFDDVTDSVREWMEKVVATPVRRQTRSR